MTYPDIELSEENVKEIEELEHSDAQFEYLVTSHQDAVREHVAINSQLPSKYAYWMSKDVRTSVRAKLAENPNIDSSIIEILSNDQEIAVLCSIAKNPRLPQSKMQEFAKHVSYLVRDAVASNPSISENLLTLLKSDSEWGVRRRVAENRNSRNKSLETLENDPSPEVVFAVASNTNSSAELLNRILEKENAQGGRRSLRDAILRNPAFPEKMALDLYRAGKMPSIEDPEDRELLSSSEDRISIAQRCPMSESLIEEIITDPYSIVRSYLARNLSLSDNYLSKLALDPDASVRTDVASNPNSSPETKAAATLLGLEEY